MVERRHDLIVIGVDEEEKWCIGREPSHRQACRDRWDGKIGSAIRGEAPRLRDVAASGKTKNPDAVAGDAHSGACERTRRTACCPSAIASGMTVFRRSAILAESLASLSPVRMTRYLRMNAATPMEFSQRARSVPFMTDPEFAKTAAGTNDHRRAGAQRRGRGNTP